jgi:hypothetical protein
MSHIDPRIEAVEEQDKEQALIFLVNVRSRQVQKARQGQCHRVWGLWGSKLVVIELVFKEGHFA